MATINENFAKAIKRSEGGANYTESLLREYGYAKRHPRTGEIIVAQTSDIEYPQPKIAHNQHSNAQVKSGAYYIDKTTGEITGEAQHRKTAQWESVWYHYQRRK